MNCYLPRTTNIVFSYYCSVWPTIGLHNDLIYVIFLKLWLGLNELWNIDLIIQVVFQVVWKKDKTVVNIAARILFFFNYVC